MQPFSYIQCVRQIPLILNSHTAAVSVKVPHPLLYESWVTCVFTGWNLKPDLLQPLSLIATKLHHSPVIIILYITRPNTVPKTKLALSETHHIMNCHHNYDYNPHIRQQFQKHAQLPLQWWKEMSIRRNCV